MKYQKIINQLDDTINKPSKFIRRNWVEINDESWGTYDESNQIKFKYSMIRSSLCHYSDAYLNVKGTITVIVQSTAVNNRNKGATFKNWAQFINCLSRLNNAQVDDADDIDAYDVLTPMYDLLEYSNIYLKTSGSLQWSYRDIPSLNNNNVIIDFLADGNNSNSFKFKKKITGKTNNNC